MKAYFRISFTTSPDSIDKESFQKAVDFPLWIKAHCHVRAFGIGFFDIGFDGKLFQFAYTYVEVERDTFMDKRGIFAWKEFHRVVEKIEQQVKQYGFRIWFSPEWVDRLINLDCFVHGFENNIYYPNGDLISNSIDEI